MTMTPGLLLIAALAVLVSLVATPWAIRLAKWLGAIDQPQARKVHTRPIPRLGGVAVCTSFAVSISVAMTLYQDLFVPMLAGQYNWILLVSSLFMVLVLGIWDDLHAINWARKFAFQLGAGTLVYLAGLQIQTISVPLSVETIHLGYLSYPVTVLWVVGITNAFNLIDGLDGLASGVAMIASVTIAGVALLSGDILTAAISLTLAGAVLGFLVYNFNPARIFLGDSGSLVLGFILAVLSIHGSTKGSTAFSIIVPLLALGLPVMDTLLAMIRRFLGSFLPGAENKVSGGARLRSMFLPDKSHIHHQLLAHGFSHRNAVIMLYVVSCIFGASAFAVTTRGVNQSLLLVAMGLGVAMGIKLLGYREMAVFQNGALLSFFDRPLLKRSVFQRALDFAFIAVSFWGSRELTQYSGVDPAESSGFPWVLMVTCCLVQSCVFSLAGLYKETFRLSGVGDIVREAKTVTLSVLSAAIILSALAHPESLVHFMILWVLDFYFLATCVVGARLAFPVLNYLFRRQLTGGRQVLIYGANTLGLMTLQKILQYDTPGVGPVGFLDDNVALEGKMINGYPIYGGHWKLDGLLKKMKIHEILLATENLKPEVWRRLRATAEEHGVALRTSRIQVEDCTSNIEQAEERQLKQKLPRPSLVHAHASV
jgi:UDP-GlcNAc:undecaprenyl-phosphate GlcNAc-1-phosphate transferase